MPEGRNVTEMLVAPIENEVHHQQVCESLDYARRVGDSPAIVILLAQLAHSKSWRPVTETQPKEAPSTRGE